MIGTSRSPCGASRARLERALEHLDRRAAERVLRRDAGDLLGGLVPEHDLALAVDGDDAVGDVREDREAALLLERDALVQLGVRQRRGRARREREHRLDLLLAPRARLARRRRRGRRAARPPARRAGRRGTRRCRRSASGRARAGAGRRRRPRAQPASGLHDVAGQPARSRGCGCRAPRRLPRPSAALTTSSSSSSTRIAHASALHELRRLLHDLVEHGGRVELGREQTAGARQLLRQRAGAALGLEQLAPLERAARRVGEVARELEVVVAERRAPRRRRRRRARRPS